VIDFIVRYLKSLVVVSLLVGAFFIFLCGPLALSLHFEYPFLCFIYLLYVPFSVIGDIDELW
jgi:hypothetical protein